MTAGATYSECVLGYRAWDADAAGCLWPISDSRRPWAPGVNTARCNCDVARPLRLEWSDQGGRGQLEPAPEHDAPAPGCTCGLYSWRRPPRAWWDARADVTPPCVVGAVAAWGRVEVHDDGFRAEHACVVTLAHRADADAAELATLAAIARRYRVDLVPLELLEQAAAEHGAALGDHVRPAPAPAPKRETPRPAAVRPAPDARPEELEILVPRGFDGRPLRRSGLIFDGSGVAGG